MKLLLDQNLSFRLCRSLADFFPGSVQVRQLGLDRGDDRTIWEYAKANGFMIISQDSDFADLAALLGPPPKVIWLRCGNQPTKTIEQLLRNHKNSILIFESDDDAECLEIL